MKRVYVQELISPLTLYHRDNTIFEYFNTPEGLDRDVAIDTILLETSELSTIYTRPETFQFAIKCWTYRRFPIWTKLYNTTKLEYNPIENYNRIETIEESLQKNSDKTANSTIQNSERIEKNAQNSGGYTYNEDVGEVQSGSTESTIKKQEEHNNTNENVQTNNLENSIKENATSDNSKNRTETIVDSITSRESGNSNRNENRDLSYNENGENTLKEVTSNNMKESGTDRTDHFVSAFNENAGQTLSTSDTVSHGRGVKEDGTKDDLQKLTNKKTETGTIDTEEDYSKNGNSTTNKSDTIVDTDNSASTKTVTDKKTGNVFTTDNASGVLTTNASDKNTIATNTTSDMEGVMSESYRDESTESIHGDVVKRDSNLENSEETGNTKIHARGNIGVTTTQKMIAEERTIADFDMINYIVKDFIINFCVALY